MLGYVREVGIRIANQYRILRDEFRDFWSFLVTYLASMREIFRFRATLRAGDNRFILWKNLVLFCLCCEMMAGALFALIAVEAYAKSIPAERYYPFLLLKIFLAGQLFFFLIVFNRTDKKLTALRKDFDFINSREAVDVVGKICTSFFFWRRWIVKAVFPRQVREYFEQ